MSFDPITVRSLLGSLIQSVEYGSAVVNDSQELRQLDRDASSEHLVIGAAVVHISCLLHGLMGGVRGREKLSTL
jgi:hypothetical protein